MSSISVNFILTGRKLAQAARRSKQPVPLIARLIQVSESYVRQVIYDFNEKAWTLWAQNGAGAGRRRPSSDA